MTFDFSCEFIRCFHGTCRFERGTVYVRGVFFNYFFFCYCTKLSKRRNNKKMRKGGDLLEILTLGDFKHLIFLVSLPIIIN